MTVSCIMCKIHTLWLGQTPLEDDIVFHRLPIYIIVDGWLFIFHVSMFLIVITTC